MNTETQRKTTTKSRIPKETRVPAAQVVVAPPTTTITAKSGAPAAPMAPTREEIARRAYELYLARGKADGHQLEDWVQAERELLAVTHRYN
jgi:hypothetical protein